MGRVSWEKFQKVSEPKSVIRHINRLIHNIGEPGYNSEGVDVFNEDWDNLIILDSCRYDVYSELADTGQLESRISRGSMTEQWTEANFADRDLRDTVYVTANGMGRPVEKGAKFHEFVPVWLEDQRKDTHERISRPATLTERAIELAESNPHKRLLIHYIQPHVPFLGKSGDKFEIEKDFPELAENHSDEVLWEAYRENTNLVLDEVSRLLDILEGKTVISADHGQMIGEGVWPVPYREYGHPRGIYTEELVKVPWDIHHNGSRKEVKFGEEVTGEEYNADELDDHLTALGYR